MQSENPKDVLGRMGEALASAYLRDRGMTILDQNWRCPQGELDLVARVQDTLVIVEVKTRASLRFGYPSAAVTPDKQRRLRQLAARWSRQHGATWHSIRIDVIAIVIRDEQQPRIHHIPGAC